MDRYPHMDESNLDEPLRQAHENDHYAGITLVSALPLRIAESFGMILNKGNLK